MIIRVKGTRRRQRYWWWPKINEKKRKRVKKATDEATRRWYLGDFMDWWRATTFLLLSPFKLLLLPLVTSFSWGGGLGAKFGLPWLMILAGVATVGGVPIWGVLLNNDDRFAIASDMLEVCGDGGLYWALKVTKQPKAGQSKERTFIKRTTNVWRTYLCFDLISFTNEFGAAGGVV